MVSDILSCFHDVAGSRVSSLDCCQVFTDINRCHIIVDSYNRVIGFRLCGIDDSLSGKGAVSECHIVCYGNGLAVGQVTSRLDVIRGVSILDLHIAGNVLAFRIQHMDGIAKELDAFLVKIILDHDVLCHTVFGGLSDSNGIMSGLPDAIFILVGCFVDGQGRRLYLYDVVILYPDGQWMGDRIGRYKGFRVPCRVSSRVIPTCQTYQCGICYLIGCCIGHCHGKGNTLLFSCRKCVDGEAYIIKAADLSQFTAGSCHILCHGRNLIHHKDVGKVFFRHIFRCDGVSDLLSCFYHSARSRVRVFHDLKEGIAFLIRVSDRCHFVLRSSCQVVCGRLCHIADGIICRFRGKEDIIRYNKFVAVGKVHACVDLVAGTIGCDLHLVSEVIAIRIRQFDRAFYDRSAFILDGVSDHDIHRGQVFFSLRYFYGVVPGVIDIVDFLIRNFFDCQFRGVHFRCGGIGATSNVGGHINRVRDFLSN